MTALYKVKAHPNAKENCIRRRGPDSFEAWVRAEPREGRANAAVLALLSRELGVAAKRLRVVKGASSPAKIVALLGQSSGE